MLSESQKKPYIRTMLGWFRKSDIFTSWTNWSIISRMDYLATFLMAKKKPDFLWMAGKTLPNRPSPLHAPSWKS